MKTNQLSTRHTLYSRAETRTYVLHEKYMVRKLKEWVD